MTGRIGLSLIATLLCAGSATAQVRADPGVVIGNRVAVRVNVTLADEETSYFPVRGLLLVFTRSPADTVLGRTDEAGVVTLLLAPGDYQVASRAASQFKGAWYTWAIPVTVKPEMRAVELNRANARVDRNGIRVARGPANRQVQSGGDVSSSGSARTSSGGGVRGLSMGVGGAGGLTGVTADGGLHLFPGRDAAIFVRVPPFRQVRFDIVPFPAAIAVGGLVAVAVRATPLIVIGRARRIRP